MLQTILQFIILPIASGAFGGWVFFRVLKEKTFRETAWPKIILSLFLAIIILLIPVLFIYTNFSFNLVIIWLTFFAVFGFLYLVFFAISFWVGLELGRIIKIFFSGDKSISRKRIFKIALVGGLAGGLIIYPYSAIFTDILYNKDSVLFIPILDLVGVFLGVLGAVLINKISKR